MLLAFINVFDLVAVQAVHETGQASGGARRAAAAVAGLLDDYGMGGGNGRQRAGVRQGSQNES